MPGPRFMISIAAAFSLAACAVPQFDVPYTARGPDASSIVRRIQCEMKEMVVADKDNPASFNRDFLLNNDYDVAIALSLDVTNTGGASPSLSYLNPLATAATSFALSGSGTFSEARESNFTANIQESFREIYLEWKQNNEYFQCPAAQTNLAGDLGIRDFVALAARTLDLKQTLTPAEGSVFGGLVQFLVTKQVNSFGPTWTLVHFVGPGSVNLSQVNTDKITLAFARGPNVGKPITATSNPPNPNANAFLQQLLLGQISTQLSNQQAPSAVPGFLPFFFARP
jgi:hypothetical protein